MSDHLAAGGAPLDAARFSTTGPLRPMTIERAHRVAQGLASDGASPSEVRQFLNLHGFDAQPVFDVIEGGKGKSDG